jgi:hypothetical protein
MYPRTTTANCRPIKRFWNSLLIRVVLVEGDCTHYWPVINHDEGIVFGATTSEWRHQAWRLLSLTSSVNHQGQIPECTQMAEFDARRKEAASCDPCGRIRENENNHAGDGQQWQ